MFRLFSSHQSESNRIWDDWVGASNLDSGGQKDAQFSPYKYSYKTPYKLRIKII